MKLLPLLCVALAGAGAAQAVENTRELKPNYLMEEQRTEPQREGEMPGEHQLRDGTRVLRDGKVIRPDGTTFSLGPNQRLSEFGDVLEGTEETPASEREPAVKEQ